MTEPVRLYFRGDRGEQVWRLVPWSELSWWERLVERTFPVVRLNRWAPTWLGAVEVREWETGIERGDRGS